MAERVLSRQHLVMRGRAVLVATMVAGMSLGLAARASAQEVTTSTILPIGVHLDVSPTSGPPATVVTVQGPYCSAALAGNFVTLTFNGVDQNIPVEAQGGWTATVTIPNDAEQGDEITITALCANESTTVFRYFPETFTVAATVHNPGSTVTTVLIIDGPGFTTSTAVGGPIDDLDVVSTLPGTVGITAELPQTGANDPTGLTALAVSLVGAGGLLGLSRRFRR